LPLLKFQPSYTPTAVYTVYARKFGLQINQEKTKYIRVKRKNSLKKNKIGHLKIKNYNWKSGKF